MSGSHTVKTISQQGFYSDTGKKILICVGRKLFDFASYLLQVEEQTGEHLQKWKQKM